MLELLRRSSPTARLRAGLLLTGLLPAANPGADPGDWPTWGHDETRSMSCAETGLPRDFHPGKYIGASDDIDPETGRNLKWLARLGSESYGNPTVSGGRVFVGTNNDAPRDPRLEGDRSCVYCLDEATGELLWQLVVPKLGTGVISDWDGVGICSPVTVEGDRAYLVTNRCEVLCLDVGGLADGNDGPFEDEARYRAGADEEPLPLTEHDADVVWVLDMIETSGIQPHNITSSSVLAAGGVLWVSTSNGVDVEHGSIPAPDAPSLIMVDKGTGRLLATEASGISSRVLHANWTSPAYLRTDETELCIFGGPDGFCYAFAPEAVAAEDGKAVLREVWRTDCNPSEYRVQDGKPVRYGARRGPSELLATPVTADGRVYCVIGQDPGNGEGAGNMTCLDAAGRVLWSYGKINRSMSTPAVVDGLVYAADYSGFMYCLDARTGEEQWVHDTKGHVWGSPLVADGAVYLGNEDGFMTIVAAGREYDEDAALEIDMVSPIYSSAIAANGVLFVATQAHLFAFEAPGEKSGD